MKRVVITLLLLLSSIGAGVLSLQSAVDRALIKGRETTIDSLDDLARQWQKKNVIAGYLPHINYNVTLLHIDKKTRDNANMSFDMMGPLPADIQSQIDEAKMKQNGITHEVSLTQPIFNGGSELVAIKMAKHTKTAQEEQYKANRNSTVLSVTKNYFDLLNALEQKKLLEADLEWTTINRDRTQDRFESGISSETDLLQWESSVIEKKSTINQIDVLIDLYKTMLLVEMGEKATSSETFDIEDFTSFEEQYSKTEEIQEGSIENNPLVKSLDGYRELSHDSKRMATTSFLPKVNGFATYQREQNWDSGEEVITKDGTWSAGLTLSIPLFSGFRNSTGYLEKKYDAMKANVDLEKTKEELTINKVRLIKQIKANRLAVASTKEQIMVTEKSVSIMNDRYSLGQVSQIELEQLKQTLLGIQLGYVTKVLETLYYQAEYNNLIGALEATK